MAKVNVYNMQGQQVEELELNDAIFGVEINENLLHRAVVTQLANKRQGTQSALTRAEVRGGGAKPWRQKGTGRARQGSIRSPQWKGGGVVFAPKPRDYSKKMNKKEKRIALQSALASKVADNKFIVLDQLSFDEIKTKNMIGVLGNLNVEKALIVIADENKNVVLSARNVSTVKTSTTSEINVYDLLKYETCIVTKDAVAVIEEVYA